MTSLIVCDLDFLMSVRSNSIYARIFMSSFEASSDLPSPAAFPAGFASVCPRAAAPNNTTAVAIRIVFIHFFSFGLHGGRRNLDAWASNEDLQYAGHPDGST